MLKNNKANSLINETSPYLLQHAYNPVNWYAWTESALTKAVVENKLILISIGYSSCHWCHVMERECFEDEQVAKLMNEHFVCIKVDREERPDIDQVYMAAVQLMSGQGGWPLNCFALPDQRPVYGGTYFPKAKWMQVLSTLVDIYKTEPGKMYEYAERLTDGIIKTDSVVRIEQTEGFDISILKACMDNWSVRFDEEFGGPAKAPKFPLPNNYIFLMRLATLNKYKISSNIASSSPNAIDSPKLLEHVFLTLDKMAMGGIYDQLGGGFARYSTDMEWKVPHFEKMLYDNAQLLSLYAEAFQCTKKELYKEVIEQTILFLTTEMKSAEGLFYSALDADSEGVEGKYYVWTKKELENVLGENYLLFADYFNVNELGCWEHDNYILLRNAELVDFAARQNLSVAQVQEKIENAKKKLQQERNKRTKPGLDDKCLTSWNALLLKGFVDSYFALQNEHYLHNALQIAALIERSVKMPDGGLFHSYKNGSATIEGFLEDYAFVVEGYIALYEATGNEEWVEKANSYVSYCFDNFFDSASGMFYFTSIKSKALIARKYEVSDNVIPASSSSIAKSLFYLGNLLDNEYYRTVSLKMLNNTIPLLKEYGSGYSNWGILLLQQIFPLYEIAIVGNDAKKNILEFSKKYIPNKMFITSSSVQTKIPLLKDKLEAKENTIYVCTNKTCKYPTHTVDEALRQIHN
ncbi:MAG: thioredoxin domain-containing protein [Bacteroidetes bacterium]|nr:thioredoxin domain-containing protein [Bacteroidota bacterium]